MRTLGFLKTHRLRSKKNIDTIFSRGNSFAEFPLRFIWTASKTEKTECNIAISIPKKRFAHAVDRNTLKRRVRESFRILYSTYQIDQQIAGYKIDFVVVYIDNTKHSQQDIQTKLEIGLKKIITNAIHI